MTLSALRPNSYIRSPQGPPTLLAMSVDPLMRTEAIEFHTTVSSEFWDLTECVLRVVERSDVAHGQVTVHSPHTTSSIVVNEIERGFLNDLRNTMEGLVPEDIYYEHDDHSIRTENMQPDEYINGHAHCRQAIVGQTSVTLPVFDGMPLLGRWQRILFVELDQARRRRVFVHVQGTCCQGLPG